METIELMFDSNGEPYDQLMELAVSSGRIDLVREIIRRNPGFAMTLDKHGNRYPIHLASENCQVEIVKELIRIQGDSTQCFLIDKEGRTPFDYAAMKGSVGVICELLSACSNDQETYLVEKALHFAIQNNQREAFRFLAMRLMKDWDSKTVENIKTTNKLLMDAPRLSSVAAPSTEDLKIEAFNQLLTDASRDLQIFVNEDSGMVIEPYSSLCDLEEFLAEHPLISIHLHSGFYPLKTYLRIAVFAGQTDDLLKKIISRRSLYQSVSHYYQSMSLCESLSLYQSSMGFINYVTTNILHMASRLGCVEIVKLLLNQFGRSLCLLKDSEGRTALHCAVTPSGYRKTWGVINEFLVINELLSACWESIREVTVKGETALHLALKQEDKLSRSSSKILLKKHIENEILNNNDNWDGNNITIVSDVADKYIKIVNELFSQDDCQLCLVKNMEGRSDSLPYYAVIKGKNKDDILHRLFSVNYPEYIPDVTAQNQTVLRLSIDKSSLITLKVLLGSHMVEVDENEMETTVIIWKSHSDDVRVPLLIWISKMKMATPCSTSSLNKKKSNLVGVASVNYQTYEDVIRLLDVVRMGDLETFNELVDEDPSVLDKVASFPTLGGTPLEIAMTADPLHTNIVIEIINRRPNFASQLNRKGMGPIHLASGYLSNVEIVRELLTKVGSGQCLLLDGNGETALHHAAGFGNVDVINELFSALEFGETPLEFAVDNEEREATKILMERYIEDELLNNNRDWNGNRAIVSNLAKEYVQIMKELLNPQQVGSSLCILEKKIIEGNEEHCEYYAVIKGTSYNNIPHLISLHPKVTAKSQTVLHLSVVEKSKIIPIKKNEKSKITLKFLLRSPLGGRLFYKLSSRRSDESVLLWSSLGKRLLNKIKKNWGKDLFEEICSRRSKKEVEVDENEMETTVIIWKSVFDESHSDDVRVPNEVAGTISSYEIVHDGNKELPEDVENDSGEKPPAKTANEERVLDVHNPIMKQAPSPLQDGDMFRSLEECRIAIIDAMVLAKRVVRFQNSGEEKIVVKCSNRSCEWRIKALPKKNIDGFVVKIQSGNHTCPTLTSAENKLATPTWVSYHVKEEVKKEPEFEPKQIQRFIRSKFGIDITNTTAWRAKVKALERIHGSWTESYKKLPEYLNRVLQSNPEGIAFLETITDNKFHRCAPLVFIDGIRTEQGLGGAMILAVVGVDGNNDMILIAFAVADANSINMWEWFLSQLQSRILQHPGYNKMTIISNHLYGLAEVINVNFPKAMHGHCTWNSVQIMEKKFRHNKVLLNFYWQTAKVLTNEEYNQALMGLKLKNVEAADWIEKNHPEFWAASKFEGDIHRHITSNVAEKFSKWIGPLRHLPILAMLKQIHEDLIEFFRERRAAAINFSSCLTEYVEKFIEKAVNASTSFSVIEMDTSIYEVHDNCWVLYATNEPKTQRKSLHIRKPKNPRICSMSIMSD